MAMKGLMNDLLDSYHEDGIETSPMRATPSLWKCTFDGNRPPIGRVLPSSKLDVVRALDTAETYLPRPCLCDILTVHRALASGMARVGAHQASSVGTNHEGDTMSSSAHQPFEQLIAFELSDGQGNGQDSIVVPSGKRFVIEFITAIVTVQVGQNAVVTFFVQTGGVGAPGIVHCLALTPQGTFIGATFAASQLVRLYADPGTTVIFELARSAATGVASGNISVTGYLEDAL
jgi:hypothetical protein